MAATMTRIAQEAGVSVAVVSRLLRGDRTLRISDARRRLILDISDRCGGVRTRKKSPSLTKTILMPINRRFSGTWAVEELLRSPILLAAEQVFRDAGFSMNLTLFDHQDRVTQFEALIRSGTTCDGLLFSSGIVNEEVGELVRSMRFPHVSWSTDAERYQVCTVNVHAADGLRQAVAHLRELGHCRIGFFGVRDHPRCPLVVASLVAAGLSMDEHYSCWFELGPVDERKSELHARAVAAFGAWLDNNTHPTAFLCSNDALALSAAEAMRNRGMTPGRELSLIGFDNVEEQDGTASPQPFLTTIDRPSRTIGARVAQLLLNQILHGQTQIVHERIPTRLIVRQSTGPALRSQ